MRRPRATHTNSLHFALRSAALNCTRETDTGLDSTQTRSTPNSWRESREFNFPNQSGKNGLPRKTNKTATKAEYDATILRAASWPKVGTRLQPFARN